MLKRTIIAVISILAAGVVLAQAYKWTDENGLVHYSDRPVEGAVRVVLPTDGRRPRPAPLPRATPRAEDTAEPAAAFSYELLSFGTPLPEETLWNIEGVLNVSLVVQPALQQGHRVRVYFDGTPRMVTGSTFQIEEVYRGVHNIQAEIIDEADALMIRSMPNRFYVQQNSINN
jgi:hypothetical protein